MAARPIKRRKLSPPSENDDIDAPDGLSNGFKSSAAQWDLEQAYERTSRRQQDKTKKESTRLPIKTAQGQVERYVPADVEHADDRSESSFASLESEPPATDVSQREDEVPRLSPKQEIIQAKEELAKLAGLLNESPEDHVGSLKTMATITSSKNPFVTKLGLGTQLAVYKDIIPGYRIRALSEDDMNTKMSKEVRQQRNFEQAIVRGYQTYLKELSRLAHLDRAKDSHHLADVAISCACNLLEHVAHFNNRNDLIRIIMDVLSAGPFSAAASFDKSRLALEKLFGDDEDGNASLEAVDMLSKTIKGRNLRIHEAVLDTLLHLRLLSEFAHKASTSTVDKPSEGDEGGQKKMSKKDRQYRTKKERKIAKERKAIAKEMSEADAVVSYEQRDKNQAETLKLVLGIYFRILKARVPKLMGATLEGVVRYAHLINQELFGDLLEALREIISDEAKAAEPANGDVEADTMPETPHTTARHSLLSTVTAFGLLSGQDAAASANTLHLDLSFFTSHLYSSLHTASLDSDLELSATSPTHAPDPTAPNSGPRATVNASTTIVLLLRALRAVLLPSNPRAVPPVRVAAFTKQLMTLATQVPEKSAAAVVALVTEVLRAQRARVAGLWKSEERRGDGVYDATSSVESSNPFATNVFEGELLRLHFAPRVREGVGRMDHVLADIG